jgi:stearoyl-CoA desaturase (delta-9 desaturase)
MQALIQGRRFKPLTFWGLVAIHLAALLVFFPYFFSWFGVALCLLMIWATASLGVSLTYHRLLSHKSWQPAPWLRHVLLFLAGIALQSGPITWSATHRLHHRESDHEDDPHSPLVSFIWSHLIWHFWQTPQLDDPAIVRRLAPDLVDDPVLQFYERNNLLLWGLFAAVTCLAGFVFGGGGLAGLQLGLSLAVWGTMLRTVLVWHNTWFVNSATHLWGYRNYNTADDSRNLWWVALLTFGEGWHNNHHAMAGSAKFSQQWWEFDPTYTALTVFQRLGWVRKVNAGPSLNTLAGKRAFTGKIGAQSPKLLRSADRKALQPVASYFNCPVTLAAALSTGEQRVREAAALALGRIGARAKVAVDPLVRALADESERVREAALQALVRIGDAAVPVLEHAALAAEEALVRLGCQRALVLLKVPVVADAPG